MSAREFLLDQWARHPASRLQDLRKALYQSTFGCGHLVDNPSAAADWIRREAEHAPDCREMEPLDGSWCRVPLGILSEGLTPETLAAKRGGCTTAFLDRSLPELLDFSRRVDDHRG